MSSNKVMGASPSGPGHSAKPEPVSAVSAQGASVPSAKLTHIVSDLRVPTGPIQFGDDWPGVFIRGDEAQGLAFYLRGMRETKGEIAAFYAGVIPRIVRLFESCHASNFASAIEVGTGETRSGSTAPAAKARPDARKGDA